MENLSKHQRSDLVRQEKKLETIASLGERQLKSAIINPFKIEPRFSDLSLYVSAITELGKDLSKLPNAEYNVFLEGVGTYYNLEVGIKGLDTSNKLLLEKPVKIIYNAVERAGWTSRISGMLHNQECVDRAVNNLIKNDGCLEYLDRITFFTP